MFPVYVFVSKSDRELFEIFMFPTSDELLPFLISISVKEILPTSALKLRELQIKSFTFIFPTSLLPLISCKLLFFGT